jgi:hypothetical protein
MPFVSISSLVKNEFFFFEKDVRSLRWEVRVLSGLGSVSFLDSTLQFD